LNYNVLCLRIFNAPVLGFLRRQLAELLVAGGRLLVLLGVVVAVSQGGKPRPSVGRLTEVGYALDHILVALVFDLQRLSP